MSQQKLTPLSSPMAGARWRSALRGQLGSTPPGVSVTFQVLHTLSYSVVPPSLLSFPHRSPGSREVFLGLFPLILEFFFPLLLRLAAPYSPVRNSPAESGLAAPPLHPMAGVSEWLLSCGPHLPPSAPHGKCRASNPEIAPGRLNPLAPPTRVLETVGAKRPSHFLDGSLRPLPWFMIVLPFYPLSPCLVTLPHFIEDF